MSARKGKLVTAQQEKQKRFDRLIKHTTVTIKVGDWTATSPALPVTDVDWQEWIESVAGQLAFKQVYKDWGPLGTGEPPCTDPEFGNIVRDDKGRRVR